MLGHVLYLGGEDHHSRIPFLLAIQTCGFRVTPSSDPNDDPANMSLYVADACLLNVANDGRLIEINLHGCTRSEPSAPARGCLSDLPAFPTGREGSCNDY